MAPLEELVDSREELAVEQDRVHVRGEFRRVFGLDLLEFRIGVGAREIAEDALHPTEGLARKLQGDDGVLEGGRILVGDDRRHLLPVFGHAPLEALAEMLVADAVEGRVLVGQRTRSEQRIVGTGRLRHRGNLLRRLRWGRRGGLTLTGRQGEGHEHGEGEWMRATHGSRLHGRDERGIVIAPRRRSRDFSVPPRRSGDADAKDSSVCAAAHPGPQRNKPPPRPLPDAR